MDKIVIEKLKEEDSELIQTFSNDQLCNLLIQILTNKNLQYMLIPKARKIESKILESKVQELLTNGHIYKLHAALTNKRAALIFLRLDYSIHIAEMARRLKKSPRSKNPRSSVRYWLKVYTELGLIKLATQNPRPKSVHIKNYTDFPKLIKFLNYICMLNLKNMATRYSKSMVGTDLSKRDFL